MFFIGWLGKYPSHTLPLTYFLVTPSPTDYPMFIVQGLDMDMVVEEEAGCSRLA